MITAKRLKAMRRLPPFLQSPPFCLFHAAAVCKFPLFLPPPLKANVFVFLGVAAGLEPLWLLCGSGLRGGCWVGLFLMAHLPLVLGPLFLFLDLRHC